MKRKTLHQSFLGFVPDIRLYFNPQCHQTAALASVCGAVETLFQRVLIF